MVFLLEAIETMLTEAAIKLNVLFHEFFSVCLQNNGEVVSIKIKYNSQNIENIRCTCMALSDKRQKLFSLTR